MHEMMLIKYILFFKIPERYVYVTAGQNYIQVKIILTWFDSQFPLSCNPNYS